MITWNELLHIYMIGRASISPALRGFGKKKIIECLHRNPCIAGKCVLFMMFYWSASYLRLLRIKVKGIHTASNTINKVFYILQSWLTSNHYQAHLLRKDGCRVYQHFIKHMQKWAVTYSCSKIYLSVQQQTSKHCLENSCIFHKLSDWTFIYRKYVFWDV